MPHIIGLFIMFYIIGFIPGIAALGFALPAAPPAPPVTHDGVVSPAGAASAAFAAALGALPKSAANAFAAVSFSGWTPPAGAAAAGAAALLLLELD